MMNKARPSSPLSPEAASYAAYQSSGTADSHWTIITTQPVAQTRQSRKQHPFRDIVLIKHIPNLSLGYLLFKSQFKLICRRL